MAVTFAFQIALYRNQVRWDNGGARWLAGFTAAATLALWVAVTFAGRGRWLVNFLPR
jgi:hypothetical protein